MQIVYWTPIHLTPGSTAFQSLRIPAFFFHILAPNLRRLFSSGQHSRDVSLLLLVHGYSFSISLVSYHSPLSTRVSAIWFNRIWCPSLDMDCSTCSGLLSLKSLSAQASCSSSVLILHLSPSRTDPDFFSALFSPIPLLTPIPCFLLSMFSNVSVYYW